MFVKRQCGIAPVGEDRAPAASAGRKVNENGAMHVATGSAD